MILDEQLQKWVEGESIHRRTADHGNLEAVSPPGKSNRIWKCLDCSAQDTLDNLRKTECSSSGGECVPDFSCCRPDLAIPTGARREYVMSSPRLRDRFLMSFLSAALEGKNVHIAGRGESET